MEKLTIQEEEVMIYIWELQCCFVKDIVAKYTQPAPPYTTVASIVKNLERKGYVTPKRVGINPEKPDVPLNKNDAFQKVQKRRVQEKR